MTEPTAFNPNQFAGQAVIHWVFLGMSATIIFLSFVMTTDGGSAVFLPGFSTPLPESCGAKTLAGFSCPGCGLTRSFISISHGELGNAWHFNPAGIFVYLFVAMQIPWQLYQLWRVKTGRGEIVAWWILLPLIICSVILLSQWFVRLALGTVV